VVLFNAVLERLVIRIHYITVPTNKALFTITKTENTKTKTGC
jgi:hypothetical protein